MSALTDYWRDYEQRVKKEAEEKQRPPDPQCCFGAISTVGIPRCEERAVWACTFYGFTTGLSWCAEHGKGGRESKYPHGQIRIV